MRAGGACTGIAPMENSSLVNYLSEWPLNLLSGIIAGVGVVILMAAVRLMLDMEAVQFGLMALIAVSVSIFAYKTEVTKQESIAGNLEGSKIEHARSEYEAALRRGLEVALRTHE
jgi:hypothetical protein